MNPAIKLYSLFNSLSVSRIIKGIARPFESRTILYLLDSRTNLSHIVRQLARLLSADLAAVPLVDHVVDRLGKAVFKDPSSLPLLRMTRDISSPAKAERAPAAPTGEAGFSIYFLWILLNFGVSASLSPTGESDFSIYRYLR